MRAILAPLRPDMADEASRVRLAANPAAAEHVLEGLAADPAITVRAALALNRGVSPGLSAKLAQDGDARVRTLLGRRLASMLPSLMGQQRDRLQEQALETLMTLVSDEAEMVRAEIADIVKDMPEAPHALILRLVRDTAMTVAEPVIRLSPLLTPEDLLALLAAAPAAATATAVARRPGLAAQVADVIAQSADNDAVTALLTNPSAAIRENTLDALVGRAAAHVDWHVPLVRRKLLSTRAARDLSDIVATQLLAELAARADLAPALTHELRQRLAARLEPSTLPDGAVRTVDEAMAFARALAADGKLTEETMLEAALRGEAPMCAALLAVAAGMQASVVERAATLRSPKGLVSLVWKAGMSMRVAGPLQTLLARLSPETTLRAMDGEEFPLAAEEMRWQIEFLSRMGR